MSSIVNILKGKQIGYREDRTKDNIKFYYEIAVQKWEGKFKIFIREVEENKIAIYEDVSDESEKVIQVDTIEGVLKYFDEKLQIDIEKLRPLKGQKIFNPRF